ncbi:leucine-rich repeat domain-containing protein [Paenibacillus lentus]|uniref:Leucine-rich repeat domain-containing protein n=1 Tax=Paenibacillus lentus TaxID=1338368 RepID=A0A3S8RSN0_9BACL|nr:leucine-rich repeat domain-containing protein [Paenibacillus lentus]AZK45959.1 leucine-rich repeat domain-containing protein [Paenibacillus lentus]
MSRRIGNLKIVIILSICIMITGCLEKKDNFILNNHSNSMELESGKSGFPQIVEERIRNALASSNLNFSEDDLAKVEFISFEGISEPVDLSSLSRLENLSGINLSYVNVENFEFLYELPHLDYLELNGVSLEELPDFNKLHLQSISISDSNVKDINFIKNWNKLVSLTLSNCQLANIEGIEQAKKLKTLRISNNPVKDLQLLSELNDLERVEINSTQIESINSLENNKNLTFLDIRNTPINTVASLSKLPKLKILLANKDKIMDLDMISDSVTVSETNVLEY